jgi:predicted membrane channel-forming protein YqfA (hemolysin III family)
MTVLAEKIVDWATIGKVVLYSAGAGLGTSICFALAILGVVRFADMRRAERRLVAGVYALLGTAGLAASAAAIVVAIIVMTQKS